MKKIIEITFETERLLIFHRQGRRMRTWCERCDSEVRVVTPVEAASLRGISSGDICREAEAGAIHSVRTAEGEMFICLQSLSNE
jgi:hypothetical protein